MRTLAPMPTAPQSEAHPVDAPAPAPPPPDPFAWDADPLVVVSRRGRIVMFPSDLLRADATPEQIKAWTTWKDARADDRDEKQFVFAPGVNFVACRTSAWHLLHIAPQVAQGNTAAPDALALRTIALPTNGADIVAGPNSGNLDSATGRVRPDALRLAFCRVLDFLQTHRPPRGANLWSAADGFDAPELMLMPLSHVLAGKGERGEQAKQIVLASLKHLRRTNDSALLVGALHDYAIRRRDGQAIAAECRVWAQKKQVRA